MSYLDLEGLTNYDTKIKAYITEKTSGGGSVVGKYFVDASNLTAEEINAQLSEASEWAANSGCRADVCFVSSPLYSNMANINWKSNCNYYLKYNASGQSMNLSNVTNAGFYFLNLNTVASEMIKLSYCSNLDFYNCSIINVMGSNLIENSTNIYFENCKIKGGTYPNPTKCSCKISDVVPNTEHYIIFENCIFDYSSGSAWDTVIDGSGITNSKCRITLINCLNPSGSFITAADITKGSGQWYALTPSAL